MSALVAPGEHWFHGKLEFMLSQRGKPLLVHDGHTFGIQYVRKDKKYWQCNLSRKFNCKARVTTTDKGEILVTNNEHCHTEIRQHLRKDYQRNKVMMNALLNLSTNIRRQSKNDSTTNNFNNLNNFSALASHSSSLLNAAATAAVIGASNSGHMHSFHSENVEQPQHHIPGVVDFTKDRGENSPSTRIDPPTHNQLTIDENADTSVPLDCGLRQATVTAGPSDFEKEVNNRGNNYNGTAWKCKNEIVDS
ncbi:PREDICTED: uncharacterized protein LOC108371449 isoform X1 [Rhagoletis zephyria]|uniref:uncharacterized protein LOC108371449 isoform X1 n=2 Tax=Rhagoletis zephyria TaxID=28612 RepID=UPI00081123AD|nr:PREDICTED: uncharacterized protein LOC108371449 isoform X1 [Rhagoletis zephyria]